MHFASKRLSICCNVHVCWSPNIQVNSEIFKMASLVVGDKGCEFNTIVELALQTESVGENWIKLAKALGCKNETISLIRTNIGLKIYGPNDGIKHVLMHWRSQECNKATLVKLIDCIETFCNWKGLADNLRDSFNVTPTPHKTQLSDDLWIFSELSIFTGKNWDVLQGRFGKSKKKSAVKKVSVDKRHICLKKIEKLGRHYGDQNTPATYVLEYFGMLIHENYLYISVEFGKRSLHDVINIDESISTKCRTHYLHDATRGLDWLHRQNIIHANIKPENVLIVSHGSGSIAKLADFWLPRYIPKFHNEAVAEINWMSPEEILCWKKGCDGVCEQKSDIFSLGIVYYYTLSWGEHPFENYQTFFKQVINDEKLQVNSFLDDDFPTCNLLYWMLEKNNDERPKMHHILSHPMFWQDRKCYRFLKEVGKYYKSNSDRNSQFFSEVDNIYSKVYHKVNQSEFSWFIQIENRLFLRKSDIKTKSDFDTKLVLDTKSVFDTKSIMSLAYFFENCDSESDKLDDGIVADLFSKDQGRFDSIKYTQYFLSKFPDLLIIIFAALSTSKDIASCDGFSPFLETFLERKEFMHDPFVCSFVDRLVTHKEENQ